MLDFGLLCPAPQRAQLSGGTLRLDPARLRTGDGDPRVSLRAGLPAQGFEIRVREGVLCLEAADAAGVRHGRECLRQILRQLGNDAGAASVELPCFSISDWPDFAVRGLMLDISRTRIPTTAALHALVERLAQLRLNQLQLYTEHTFAYAGHEEVWREASPLTPDEIRVLDERCRERGIELVPNQQSFGHLHRWLTHERYRPLAEMPEGVEHAFSRAKEPFALCPTDPASLAFVEGLYDQLLPHFSSRLFNIGGDETFDLGLGRSKAECEQRGKGRVYLDYLRALEQRVRARGRRMQFWGDIVLQHPDLLAELPRDAIALEWGYEEGHPFEKNLAAFRESGLECYVCPGTSSWQSFAGRTHNMLANVTSAAAEGKRAGARGLLVTDWGDRGHLQQPLASWPGIVASAALSWNASSTGAVAARLPELLDTHVFAPEAPGLGALACELGDAYRSSRAESTNGSPLFFLVAFFEQDFPHPRVKNLTREGLLATLEYVMERRVRLESRQPDAHGATDQLRWTAGMLAFACRFGLARLAAAPGTPVSLLPHADRKRLARELEELVDQYRKLWNETSRPGGLDESIGWLTRPLAALAS
jgi:hexosaminidase